MAMRELRIHGVGGSPGEALLGLNHPDDAVVVGEGIGTTFLSRRNQRTVEGYDWGKLTSGSPLQPLWVLLLPFTLVNVAGWAHAPAADAGRRLPVLRALVHISAGLLTASWVLWVAIIAVDQLGYQWFGAHVVLPSWLGRVDQRLLGTALGGLATVLAAVLLATIAASTRKNFEAVRPTRSLTAGGLGPSRWGRNEDLTSAAFFAHEDSMDRSFRVHVAIIAGTLIAVLLKTVQAWGDPQLLVGEVLVVVGGAQVGVIALLALVSWRSSGQFGGLPAPRALPAAAVTLAVALTNGFFAGATLLATRALPPQARTWGPELALIDGFVIVVAVWAILTVGWLLAYRRRGVSDDVARRTSSVSEELDGASDAWCRRIATMRGIAQGAHAAPRLLTWFAVAFVLIGGAVGATRVDLAGPPWRWLSAPEPSVLMSVATWLLPLLVFAVMGLMWRAATRRKLRRGLGIVWDVLTFWPRRFHPLAVRPYTERAVPEFQARISSCIDRHEGLLVSAHSQGSVIAFASLAPLSADRLERTALLTYGCPITTLYGQVFPAYFGAAAVTDLRERLEGGVGWRNLWRQTDPIGGPVIGAGEEPIDEEMADPATARLVADLCDDPSHVDPEPLRRPWVELCGHSYFYREQGYKDTVAAFRTALGGEPLGMARCGREDCPELQPHGATTQPASREPESPLPA